MPGAGRRASIPDGCPLEGVGFFCSSENGGDVVLGWRGCFAGVAGELLLVQATRSNQETRLLALTGEY